MTAVLILNMETGKCMSEGGRRWLVLLASFIGSFTLGMIVWSAGVLHEIFVNEFGSEGRSAEISAISSVLMGTYACAGLVSGILVSTFSEWPVTIMGTLLASLGLVSSAFVASPLQMSFTFGGITGFGGGLMMIPLLSILPKHFDRLVQLTVGISSCGTGTGCLAGPPLIRFLEGIYGWRGAMMILGGIMLHGVGIGLLFRLPSALDNTSKKPPTKLKSSSQPRAKTCTEYLNLHLLRKANYCFFLINNLLYMVGYSGTLVHCVTYAVTIGYSEMRSALLVSIYGISSCVARLLLALFAQWTKQYISVTEMYTAVQLLTMVILFCWPLAKIYLSLATVMAAFGFCTGAWNITCNLTVVEMSGPMLMAAAYSYVMIAEAVGSFIGPALSGWLYDTTQHYPSIFYLCGASIALSVMAMIQPVIHERRKRNHSTDTLKTDTVLHNSHGQI